MIFWRRIPWWGNCNFRKWSKHHSPINLKKSTSMNRWDTNGTIPCYIDWTYQTLNEKMPINMGNNYLQPRKIQYIFQSPGKAMTKNAVPLYYFPLQSNWYSSFCFKDLYHTESKKSPMCNLDSGTRGTINHISSIYWILEQRIAEESQPMLYRL